MTISVLHLPSRRLHHSYFISLVSFFFLVYYEIFEDVRKVRSPKPYTHLRFRKSLMDPYGNCKIE